jgi:hypothetical protein
MTWWKFWKGDAADPASTVPDRAEAPSGVRLPPRGRSASPATTPDRSGQTRRLAELQRRRQEAQFDVEQGEWAQAPDNPWTERIDLLSGALAAIEADRQRLDARPTEPPFELPATPIEDVVARNDELIGVEFRVWSERFRYAEEADWDERGGPTVRGDLRRQAGDPAALLPPGDVPPDRRDALLAHLDGSLDVFATDLRDRVLADTPMPERPSLADLARPCPRCGGWRDWHGTCPECARRDLRRQELRQEAERLERERAAEAEERHRLVDRLPVARRRLALIEAELAGLEG